MAVHLAKGTRDFLPEQMRLRLHVIQTVREVFERFGFAPLETPAMERIETLTGKYGEEGEQLIFKILKRGEGAETGQCDMALRYDLTVPLARVISMNRGLRMPFKRYQVQPVWRADRPQKGRFREFWQCDVDTVGCADMTADAECVAVVHASLRALGFRSFTIRVNHRGLLRAMCAAAGVPQHEEAVLVAIDKLDKIGREGVAAELERRGVDAGAVAWLWRYLGDGAVDLDHVLGLLGEVGEGPVGELRQVLDYAVALGVPVECLRFDPTLARGLSYYTGPVFETVVDEPRIGSISGGGRYDGLIGALSGIELPAVGVSLGVERIIAVMEELGMAEAVVGGPRVLVTVFDEAHRAASLRLSGALRAAGVSTETWLERPGKLSQQYKRAHALGIPWVATLGPEEVANGQVGLKDLRTGAQQVVPLAEVASIVSV